MRWGGWDLGWAGASGVCGRLAGCRYLAVRGGGSTWGLVSR